MSEAVRYATVALTQSSREAPQVAASFQHDRECLTLEAARLTVLESIRNFRATSSRAIFSTLGLTEDQWVEIVRAQPFALQFAPDAIRGNKTVLIEAVRRLPQALMFAEDGLNQDFEVLCAAGYAGAADAELPPEQVAEEASWSKERWVAAVRQAPGIFQRAPPAIRGDREVVDTAVRKAAEVGRVQGAMVLKHAEGGLAQDPQYLGMIQILGNALKQSRSLVLSVKFSLAHHVSSTSTFVALTLQNDVSFAVYDVYFPNCYSKSFCGDVKHATWRAGHCLGKCRFKCKWGDRCEGYNGTEHRGGRKKCVDFPGPTTNHSCWAFSYRTQLEAAVLNEGIMVQIEEGDADGTQFKLGDGQVIETEIANELRVPVFRIQLADLDRRGPIYRFAAVELLREAVESWQSGLVEESVHVISWQQVQQRHTALRSGRGGA